MFCFHRPMIYILFISLMIPKSLLAANITDTLSLNLCPKNSACSPPSGLMKQSLSFCEISKKTFQCDEFVKKNPEFASLVQKCDANSYCTQNMEALLNNQVACLRGYKNALVDLGISIKDAALSLSDVVDQTWERNKKFNPHKIKASQELNATQKSHLAQMGDAAIAAIEKTKIKYNCLKPLVQAEMRCYALGTVFDPTLIFGYAVKLVRGARVVGELSEIARVNAELGIEGRALLSAGEIQRGVLVEKYLYFSPTSAQQNQKFIDLALKTKPSDNIRFVNFENAEMQALNQKLLNKNLVTSVTNYHKEIIFSKMEALKKEFPSLQMEIYSDYKSARFAFKGQAPPGFEDRLASVFTEANQEFRKTLIQDKIIRASDSPQNWVRAGVGATADQANYAARYSRALDVNQLQSFGDSAVKSQMASSFQEVEKLRSQISSNLPKESKLISGKTLDTDVFNLVRKNNGDAEGLRKALVQRYSLSDLSSKTVQNIENYVAHVNQFSPDLMIAKREVATLHEAQMGGLSADMVGMGATNLRSTAEALAQSKNVQESLEQARQMEQKVTSGFNEQRSDFNQVVANAVGPDRMKTICSGDDCVSIAMSPLTNLDKSKIIQGLADQGYSSKFRLSFIPDGISESSSRTSLATHGETIEKKVQQNLAEQMPAERLKGLIFGVDMQTNQLNQGTVKLLTGTRQDIELSVIEKEKIQQSFKKAVDQMNEELQSQGVKAQYHP